MATDRSNNVTNLAPDDPRQLAAGESLTSLAVKAMSRHRSGMVGLVIILLLAIIAVLAPVIAPYGALEMIPGSRFAPPSSAHLFGADEFGRDILSRILMGTRISFSVGVVAIAAATVVGVTIGLIAGYVGGWFDTITMRLFDALLAFPAILLAIVILAVIGAGVFSVMLAVAIVHVPGFARLTRANVLVQREVDYVEAAQAVGAGTGRIVFRHILPNVTSTIIVQITVDIADAVLLMAALSFLGLGVPPPAPSWGSMLGVGRGYLMIAPWYGIFPGLAITMMVIGFYLLGDGLRDALDPRRQKIC